MKLDNCHIAGSSCFTPGLLRMHAKPNHHEYVKGRWSFTYSFTFSLFIYLLGKMNLDNCHIAGSSYFTPRRMMMQAKRNQDEEVKSR